MSKKLNMLLRSEYGKFFDEKKLTKCIRAVEEKLDINICRAIKILEVEAIPLLPLLMKWTNTDNDETHFNNVLEIYGKSMAYDESANYIEVGFLGINLDHVKNVYDRFMFEIDQNTKLVILDKYFTNINDIYESLILRYPVYYGAPKTDLYDADKVQNALSYIPKDLPDHPEIRYCIVGPAYTIRYNKYKTFNVIHTWGINLEKTTTSDYKIFTEGKKLQVEKYRSTTFDILTNIIESALINNDKKSLIHLPLIGLGAFIGALDDIEKTKAQKVFFETLNLMLRKYEKHELKLKVCIYAITKELRPIYDSWDANKETIEFVKSGKLQIGLEAEGNLFNVYDSVLDSNDTRLYLVNAWDNKSYIGNGGVNDPTIDGFMVAATGGGVMLPNSSYLHNPFFSTHLLDYSDWVVIKSNDIPKEFMTLENISLSPKYYTTVKIIGYDQNTYYYNMEYRHAGKNLLINGEIYKTIRENPHRWYSQSYNVQDLPPGAQVIE